MSKLAVIGDRESVLLFKALGFICSFAEDAAQAKKEIRAAIDAGASIIYLTEDVARMIPDVLDRYRDQPFPILTIIPGRGGASGLSMEEITKNVERAIGTNIL